MYYLYFYFEGCQTWMEVDDDYYALRQINIHDNGVTEISCREDCLAEGVIDLYDIDVEAGTKAIPKEEFEACWANATKPIRERWDALKAKYPLGSVTTGVITYFYPQGTVLDFGDVQGLSDVSLPNLYPGDKVTGTIVGYDEVNMWLLIADSKIERIKK